MIFCQWIPGKSLSSWYTFHNNPMAPWRVITVGSERTGAAKTPVTAAFLLHVWMYHICGFPSSWGQPNSWTVCFRENPNQNGWFGGTAMYGNPHLICWPGMGLYPPLCLLPSMMLALRRRPWFVKPPPLLVQCRTTIAAGSCQTQD